MVKQPVDDERADGRRSGRVSDLTNYLKQAARMANDEGETDLAKRLRHEAARLEFAELKRTEEAKRKGTEQS